jgi:hypothetical protein
MNSMQASNGFGFLNGNSIIKMNNLAVGYFPSETPELGVYPPPSVPSCPSVEQVIVEFVPSTTEQELPTGPHSETNF